MITHLSGNVEAINNGILIIDIGGIGYKLSCSNRMLTLAKKGINIKVFTHLAIREDNISLFGFTTEIERKWFELLTTVHGVGGRVALAILSCLDDQELKNAFLLQDNSLLIKADGVGQKLASRIISELKDKVSSSFCEIKIENDVQQDANIAINVKYDVISALINLGYTKSDASSAVNSIPQDKTDFDTIFKFALATLVGK